MSRSYSQCGNCRAQTLPTAKTHDAISGYGPARPGCGARFTAISADHSWGDDHARRAILATMRPDLPIIDITEA